MNARIKLGSAGFLQSALLRFGDGRSLRHGWKPWHKSHPELVSNSPNGLIETASAHRELVWRFGRRAVVEFYERVLWPALAALPPDPQVSEAMNKVALAAIEARHEMDDPSGTLQWADRAAAALPSMVFGGPPMQAIEARRRARHNLAERLRRPAPTPPAGGREEIYRRIASLGELTPSDQQAYAETLWARRDSSPAALLVYAQHLSQSKTPPPELIAFLHERIAIDEDTPLDAIDQRLPFCHQMLLHPGPAGQPMLASRYLGVGYLRKNDPVRALPFLQLAANRNDHGGISSFHLGQAFYQTERYGDAGTAFDLAVAHGYSRARVIAWQALAEAKAGRYTRALDLFREGEKLLGPGNLTSEYMAFWGRACYLNSFLEEAEARFRSALSLVPGDWRALNGLALTLHAQGKTEEGINLLQSAVVANQSPGVTHYILGRLYAHQNAIASAASCYSAAVERLPEEANYRLALGLALDDLDDPSAVPHLTQAADSSLASFEIYRRLALRQLRNQDRQSARVWLARLEKCAPGTSSVHQMMARDLLSRTIEAYHVGEYQRALHMISQMDQDFCRRPAVGRLRTAALTLECERRLRAGESGAALWQDIERAAGQSSDIGPHFLRVFSCVLRGDLENAAAHLRDLVSQFPDEPKLDFLGALCSYFAGKEGSADKLTSIAGSGSVSSFAPLLPLFQAVAAARRGDAAACVEHWQNWTAMPKAVLQADLPWRLLNAFAAHSLRRGVARAAQAPRILAKLSEQFPTNFWSLAAVLLKQEEVAARGVAAATPEKVSACDASYQELIGQLSPERLESIAPDYSRWLQMVVLIQLHRRDAASALDALSALDSLPGAFPATIAKVKELLRNRMEQPTPEAAYSLLRRNPARAQEIWEQLHHEDASDLSTLHHLACFHWSAAHDELAEGHFEKALPHWRRALEFYRVLYANEDFWQQLRQKGESLRQPGYGFDVSAFEEFRRSALGDRAKALVELIFHFLAEGDARDVRHAADVMKLIRSSRLPASLKEDMADHLAARRLEPDPTRLADFEVALTRARQVIEVDDKNIPARVFVLRAVTHMVDVRWREGNRDSTAHARLLKSVEGEAQWLENKDHNPRFEETKTDTAAFLEELSVMCHNQGTDLVPEVNDKIERAANARDYSANRRLVNELESLLRRSRSHFQESDAAAKRSLALQSVNFTAKQRLEDHDRQYPTIENLLAQIQRAH